MLETRSERVPEVEEFVGEEEAVVLVGLVLQHLGRPPMEKAFQLIASVLPDKLRSLLRQRQTFLDVTGRAKTDCRRKRKKN